MYYLATDLGSPYNEKTEQDFTDQMGRIVTWGYDTKYVDELVLEDIESGLIKAGDIVPLCTMTLGNLGQPITPRRMACIERIKIYGIANGFVRIDLRLLDREPDFELTYPARGKEYFLFAY